MCPCVFTFKHCSTEAMTVMWMQTHTKHKGNPSAFEESGTQRQQKCVCGINHYQVLSFFLSQFCQQPQLPQTPHIHKHGFPAWHNHLTPPWSVSLKHVGDRCLCHLSSVCHLSVIGVWHLSSVSTQPHPSLIANVVARNVKSEAKISRSLSLINSPLTSKAKTASGQPLLSQLLQYVVSVEYVKLCSQKRGHNHLSLP